MFEDLPDSVLPDLMIQNAQLTRLSGEIFLDYEIKNIGQAFASSNSTQFYYSSDAVLDNSDFNVGNNITNSLQKNESFQGQIELNASPNASQKYLLIQTDRSNLITESDELNNVYAVGLDLSSTTSLSDLTISGLSVSNRTNQVTQGYGFTPTYTLRNQGNAVAGTSVTKYVLSKDAILGNADDFIPVSLANGGADAGLAAGTSRVENDDYLVIYDDIVPGSYNLFAIVDSTNTVAESNENNNVLSVSINFSYPPQPDLKIDKFTSPKSVNIGSYLNVAYTIRNIDRGYVGYSHINFYLSQNTVIDASDLSLGYHLISSDTPSNIPISRNSSIWLDPSRINAGNYNLIAKVDPNDGISESNETNNTFIKKITLNSLLLPNLSVNFNPPETIQTGFLATIPYTVFNTGGATKESQISFYLSTNSTLDSTDRLIHSQNVQALSKKSSVKADASVYLAPNLAALGTNSYYLIAMIDSAINGIAESNETNNLNVHSVTIVNSGTTQFTNNKGYGFINGAAAVASAIRQAPFADVPDVNTINWGVDLIKAPEVWERGFTGQGITVAVLDTGVDYNHPDLKDNIWVNVDEIADNGIDDDQNGFIDDVRGWNFASNDNAPIDTDGHGTHVAGIVSASRNSIGYTGIAYGSRIMPLKVLGGGDQWGNINNAIRYAVDNGARVINMSLGGSTTDQDGRLKESLEYASRRGVIVVSAAGNDNGYSPIIPAIFADQWGLAVGAANASRKTTTYSNKAGEKAEAAYVTAPESATSTLPNNKYGRRSGTSIATPYVAGVVALMLSANPTLTDAKIREFLTALAVR